MHVDQEAEYPWLVAEKDLLAELAARDAPVLGICLGAQLLAEAAGGGARPCTRPEIGWREVALGARAGGDPLLGLAPPRFTAFEWHSYEIETPPQGVVLAHSDCCLQAFRTGSHSWGIQFHAEVTVEIVAEWIAKDGEQGELAGAEIEPEELGTETTRRIAESNRLGANLCRRFLALAERAPAYPAAAS